MMNTKNLFIAAALVGIVLGAVRTASAQSNTAGAVQGVVTDKATGQPLAGVTVVATSTALQGTASAITEGDGTYKITNLPPGSYVITFYYADITVKRTGVPVSVSKVTPAYVKIDQNQAQGEVIEIKGTPTIDTTSTSQGITLDQNYTRNIPVPGRTFEAVLGAAAGSAGDPLGVSFSGSTSLENQYVVDGVNTTGLTYGTVGSPIINDFIEEIEVITGGYQAEYGRATGGVVNVVTPSGTNEFHGTVFSQFTNDLLGNDPTRNPTQATPIDARSSLQYDLSFGATLGGPIIKDKLWFFVGFAPRLISYETERITKRMTDCRMTLPDGSISGCDQSFADGVPDEDKNGFFIFEDIAGGRRTVNSQGTEYQFVSKINYSLSPEHQGQVSFSGTPFTSESIGVYGEQPAVSRDTTILTTDTSAKWTSKFNNNKTEVEAVLGWHRDHFKSDSIDDSVNDEIRQTLVYGNLGTWGLRGHESMQTVAACTDSAASDPYPFIENCPDLGVGYGIGGPGSLADDTEQRLSAKLSGTQRIKAAGTHEIKAGIDLENNLLNKPRNFSGDAFYAVYVGNTLYTGGNTDMYRWVQVAPEGETDPRYDQTCGPDPGGLMGESLRCDFLGPTDVEGNTLNWATYLRDSWQILPNLTFNAGIRYEEQRLRYARALQQTPDPYTQELRGKNAMTMKNMWAPRIGLLYDWTKEGRSKVYGSYARFYESIPMDINDRSFGGETLLIRHYDQGAQCGLPDSTIGAPSGPACPEGDPGDLGDEVFGGSGVLVAPGVRPQYLDEFIIGSEYEVLEDLKVGIALKRRTLGRVLEDVSVDSAQTYILANPGEFPEGEEEALEEEIASLMAAGDVAEATRKQGQLDQFRGIRGFDKPRRDYNALELTTQKRFSKNFFMQGSYTYARTLGNFPGLFSADNGQVDPNITSQYDLIELLANRDGPLPQDRPHSFKLDSYYIWKLDDWFGGNNLGDVTTGGRFRAGSGGVKDALGRHYLYGFDESFLLPRGEMGRNDFAWNIDTHLGYGRDLGHGMKIDVFTDLYAVEYLFMKEHVGAVDETYTFDNANPVVGGTYSDLIWVKRQDTGGLETDDPVRRNRNFQNVAGRYQPFYVQIGARLSF
jgi:hypothetical protein